MHHVLEHRRNVGKKEALFKVGEKRGVWDFFKFTEIAQFFMETKEGDEQGIGRDTFKKNPVKSMGLIVCICKL